MPRSVNKVASRARRKKLLKKTKGNWGSRKNVWTIAKNTYEKGQQYAYRDRKTKKRLFRALWIQRINAAVRLEGMSYSEFIGKLKAQNIDLNRKVLADLAMNEPVTFAAIVKQVASGKKVTAIKETIADVEVEKPKAKAEKPAKEAEDKAESSK